MPLVTFEALPDTARLWVFSASRPLEKAQSPALLRQVDDYLATWQAHGAPLRVGRDWRYERFLLVAVDESTAGASGCSIDGLVRCIRTAEEQLGITLTDNAPVWFKDGNEVRQVSRAQFRHLAQTGDVGPDTIVFNNTLTSLEAVRQERWEVPARESWHGKAFFADGLARSKS
jgi:hypothetical protein